MEEGTRTPMRFFAIFGSRLVSRLILESVPSFRRVAMSHKSRRSSNASLGSSTVISRHAGSWTKVLTMAL